MTMRVLVVEDDPVIREMIAEILIEEGVEADGVGYAEEALVLLGSGEQIDLLVTDIDLGDGLTGMDLASIARSRHAGVELLFISGHLEDRSGQSPGPHEHFLQKPFRSEDLIAILREAMVRIAPEDAAARLPSRYG